MANSTTGVKTGSRLEVKESLDIAARGLVKTHLQLRKLEELETVRTLTQNLLPHVMELSVINQLTLL